MESANVAGNCGVAVVRVVATLQTGKPGEAEKTDEAPQTLVPPSSVVAASSTGAGAGEAALAVAMGTIRTVAAMAADAILVRMGTDLSTREPTTIRAASGAPPVAPRCTPQTG
jgi:hypothetical protein